MKNIQHTIEFVYFDVGGVIILDFSGTEKFDHLLSELGLNTEQVSDFITYFRTIEMDICRGLQSAETMVDVMKKRYGIHIADGYSFTADFVQRFEKNESIWPIAEKIAKKHKVGLITNMYPNMLELIEKQQLLPNIQWDAIIDSSLLSAAKPDEAIFRAATKIAGVNANQIMLIDNAELNIDGAKQIGWQTVLYNPTELRASNNILKSQFQIL